MKPNFISMALLVGMVLLGIGETFAEERAESPKHEIRLGMDLNVVKQVLKECKIPDEVLFDLASSDPNDRWLSRSLSREVSVCFKYSARTNKVTGISVVYMHQPYCKLNQIWVPVRSIHFESDGSYVTHCEKPYNEQTTDSKGQYPPTPSP